MREELGDVLLCIDSDTGKHIFVKQWPRKRSPIMRSESAEQCDAEFPGKSWDPIHAPENNRRCQMTCQRMFGMVPA